MYLLQLFVVRVSCLVSLSPKQILQCLVLSYIHVQMYISMSPHVDAHCVEVTVNNQSM